MGGRGASFSRGGGLSKTYEDKKSGGSVLTEKGRLDMADKSKNEMRKYQKEKEMCEVLAKNGRTVIHLDDTKRSDGSYDILVDGKKADLKSTSSTNNIVKYGEEAINKQKADIVIFRFNDINLKVRTELNKLAEKGIHGYYYKEGNERLFLF